MRVSIMFLCGVMLFVGTLSGTVASAETNSPAAAEPAKAVVVAQAPGMRLAGVFAPTCIPARIKGIASVTHPSTGICCIRPKATTGIAVNRIVPTVTVEWAGSSGTDLMAFYNIGGDNCPSGTIEVRTYDLEGNLVDRAGFTILVP